jgi:UDP-N-acetylglucosamine--dolichyl-phosphate N-acetylglucosaminephosphotransferase
MVYLDPMIFNNDNYKLVLIFLYAFFATIVATPYFIKKLVKLGYIVQDKYKLGKVMIPTMGGLAMLAGIMISLALSTLFFIKDAKTGELFIFYFVIIVYAMYGVVDDLFAFRQRYDKISVLLVLSLPIGVLVLHNSINLFGLNIFLGDWLPYLLAPVYVMVVANLLNVYSGFNGQSSGLGLILLLTVAIKSFMINGTEHLYVILPILGAFIAFNPNTFYPAKILEGNVGQFMVGAAIGGFLIINNLEIFGIIILIPHIVNFILDTWVLAIRKIPDAKFGSVAKDGIIIAPKSVRFKSIKYILTYYMRLREKEAVYIIYGITILFCIIGVWLF